MKRSTAKIVYAALIFTTVTAFTFFAFVFYQKSQVSSFEYSHRILELNGRSDYLKPIDAIIPDTISYREYKKHLDSVNFVRGFKNQDLTGGGGWRCGSVGTRTYAYYETCDTCTLQGYQRKVFGGNSNSVNKYFIMLPYWTIKKTDNRLFDRDSVQYYIERGQAYIRKYADTLVKQKDGKYKIYQTLTDTPVKFRYSKFDKCILIPISQNAHQISTIVLAILAFSYIACILYLFSLFLNLIFDLSRGLAFTDQNIFRLKFIGIGSLALHVFMIILNFVLKLIFYQYFTTDISLNTEIWSDSWKIVTISITFLLLYRSFRQGKLLKDEQELTV